MELKAYKIFTLSCKKLKGDGVLKYSLFVSANGGLLVKIEENNIETPVPGSIDKRLFCLNSSSTGKFVFDGMDMHGYDLDESTRSLTRIDDKAEGSNIPGFLRAIIDDINRRFASEE